MKLNKKLLCLLILIIISPFILLANNLTYNDNYGITKNKNAKNKVYITVDLCLSKHPDYSKDLFE